jgi:hypothetical protein
MASATPRSTSRRRWSRLWLGVLFVLAQAAANVHAISHLGQDSGRSRDGALVHAQCELCLIGAAIGAAAPLPEPPAAWHPPLGVGAVAIAVARVADAAPALAYRSRAPPLAQR